MIFIPVKGMIALLTLRLLWVTLATIFRSPISPVARSHIFGYTMQYGRGGGGEGGGNLKTLTDFRREPVKSLISVIDLCLHIHNKFFP